MISNDNLKWTIIGILLRNSWTSAFQPIPFKINDLSSLKFSPQLSITSSSYLDTLSLSNVAPVMVHSRLCAQANIDSVREQEESVGATVITPIFDFTGGDTVSVEEKAKSLVSFDRIDDAIMGGISTSSLKDAGPNKPYASWSGTCRTDGGGFCGFRTLPFKEALNTTDQDGIYIDCRLASDDEPQRRVWKMTMRTEPKRTTEIVYQAQFSIENSASHGKWSRVKIPFDSFQLVRGPRLVPGMPAPNVTNGIFQIGVSLSKFVMGVNTTELPDFRAGPFDLHIQSIGFFKGSGGNELVDSAVDVTSEKDSSAVAVGVPETMTKVEADKDRPALFKILSPVLNFLFSEKARRRRSAMKVLMETRGMTRTKATLFGIKIRRKRIGFVRSVGKSLGIIGIDTTRALVKNVLKLLFFYPLRLCFALVRIFKKALGMKPSKAQTE